MQSRTHTSPVRHVSLSRVIWLIRVQHMCWSDFRCTIYATGNPADLISLLILQSFPLHKACSGNRYNDMQQHDSFMFTTGLGRKPAGKSLANSHLYMTCVTWLIHTCDMTCVTWLIHTCDMTCVTWLIHTCDMTDSHVWHDSFACVPTLVHTCG